MRFGRKLKLNAHQRREALARREAGEALTEIGRTFGVSHSTISRLRDWLLQVGTESKPEAGLPYCDTPIAKVQALARLHIRTKGEGEFF